MQMSVSRIKIARRYVERGGAEVFFVLNTDCTDYTNVCCANAAGKEPMGDSQKSCIKMGGRPKVLGMFFKECRRFF